MVGALVGACLTIGLPVSIVVLLIVTVAVGTLFYWLVVRPRRQTPKGTRTVLTPMRRLADGMRMAGVLLIAGALWLTILGFLTEFGIINESTAQWSELAEMGWRIRADQPAGFGARCLVVATAVWALGFGLTKALGEKA